MKKLIAIIVYAILFPALGLAILFDPTGVAVGVKLWPNLPTFILTVGELIGDLVWLLGIVLFFFAFVMFAVIQDPKAMQDQIRSSFQQRKTLSDLQEEAYGASSQAKISFFIVLSFFIIGVGYWFTGFAYFALVAMSRAHSKKQMKFARKVWNDFVRETDGSTLPTEHIIRFNI